MELSDLSWDKTIALYKKFFSIHYLNSNLGDKLAVIAITGYITNELRKKSYYVSCYDVLLKSLGAVCEDFMYGVKEFPDYGIPLKNMPKQLKKLLDSYVPF